MNMTNSAARQSLSPDIGGSGAQGSAAADVRGTVSVHIVTYNSVEDIEGCLECIRAQSYPIEKIVVLDNASSDGTAELLRRIGGGLTVVESPENTGFAGGQNRALAEADSDYALVLNPDVRMHPDYVRLLVEQLERCPEAGSATGMLVRQPAEGLAVGAASGGEAAAAQGRELELAASIAAGQRALVRPEGEAAAAAPPDGGTLPGAVQAWLDRLPAEALIDSTGLELDAARQARDRGAGEPAAAWLVGGETFGVSGAAAMYRRSMMEHVSIRGEFFDETFFAYKEDVDAAWRAQLLGWQALYVSEARALHARGWKEGGRAAVSLFVRKHSYENRFYTLVKNERSLLRLPIILSIETLKFGYILLKERDLLSSWPEIFRKLPEMREKRRELRSKKQRG
ncbi:glycosyltransferase family 2 protein [Paenibacillus herberti]|uniref:Glycosyl transferase family 2 n=1 Tax=Paenibacillus herberti TaxID=1619309 RepID=A0A229NWF5_9BACL|nr:glycosyltransferase family 2 protein [Paenibacillus herberti]OXM14207.1 glycosyl transferase family 2 [Paenibacillus herberti]